MQEFYRESSHNYGKQRCVKTMHTVNSASEMNLTNVIIVGIKQKVRQRLEKRDVCVTCIEGSFICLHLLLYSYYSSLFLWFVLNPTGAFIKHNQSRNVSALTTEE